MRRALVAILIVASACSPKNSQTQTETFVVASTTSTQDSGFLAAVGPAFEAAYPRYRPKVVAVGSGEAIELGRRGDADVLLVHSPDDEKKFMEEGRGVSRSPVMRNDFVVAGPADDPAGIHSSPNTAEAFRRIANQRAPFVSRGDESGTHKKELKTWAAAGIGPAGDWYLSTGQGMAETLTVASQRLAYVLTDTATFTVVHQKSGLDVLYGGDPTLVNPYSVIPVRNARHLQAALAFARWITGRQGQKFIAEFGRQQYGASLFVPTASK